MNPLHSQQMWDMMRVHQSELLKEAKNEHLARMAKQSQPGWLSNLFRREAQPSHPAINPNAAPELG